MKQGITFSDILTYMKDCAESSKKETEVRELITTAFFESEDEFDFQFASTFEELYDLYVERFSPLTDDELFNDYGSPVLDDTSYIDFEEDIL